MFVGLLIGGSVEGELGDTSVLVRKLVVVVE